MRFGYLFLFWAIFQCSQGFAQVKNEADLKKQAEQHFEDEEYDKAYKLYSQLVSNYPKDPEFNYRLGVCMLYTEPDKKKPYSYLFLATKNPKDAPKDAKFYLAKTYHMNYKFDEAIKLYNEYKAIGSSSSIKKLQVDREIAACINGKRLLSNLSDLVVIKKKQLNDADYFRSYDLTDIGGKLVIKPDAFRSGYDKKKKEKSVVYSPRNNERIYYSSYGENGQRGRDIYFVNKLPNGEYSKPQVMPTSINTEYDEDYPFLHPNGKTLYFSSKGHNSMGGYDIFKTTFDDQSQTWSKPENLDFPINSPDDDILFVTDSLEKTAYFSTGRYSPYGKIDVLKINTERRPMNFAVIKGTVAKENVTQSVKSKITVKNIENGEIVGTYQAQDDGSYFMELTNGGKFIFTVETPGIQTQSEGITIPIAYSLKPYRQAITYEKTKLKIINYFEGGTTEQNYDMMIDLIEKKATLEVNEMELNNASITNVDITNKNKTDANAVNTGNPTVVFDEGSKPNSNKNLSNEQLLSIAKEDAKEATNEAAKLKQEAKDAFGLATQKTSEANAMKKEADDALIAANSIADVTKKNEELAKANKLQNDAKIATDVANTATNMAKKLEADAALQQKEADLTNQYITEIESVIKNKNNKEAVAKLEQIQKQLDELSKQKNQSSELYESLKIEANLKQEELTQSEKKSNAITNEIKLIEEEKKDLEKDLANEKDNSIKENINAQIRELNNDVESKNKELAVNNEKIENLKNEIAGINKELEIAGKILNEKTDVVAINETNKETGDIGNNINQNGNESDKINNNKALSLTEIDNKYKTELASTPIDPSKREDLIKQNSILKDYNTSINSLIASDKNILTSSKDANEKKRINNEIKTLEKTKKENDALITSNNAKIKTLPENPIVIDNQNKNDSINKNNNALAAENNNSIQNNPDKETAITNSNKESEPLKPIDLSSNQNKNDISASLDKVGNNLNLNANAETASFDYDNYKEPTSIKLKETADKKLQIAKQNEDTLKQILAKAKEELNKYESGSAPNQNNSAALISEADALYTKANDQRKEAKTKSGPEKENLINQAKENEKLATDKKLEVAQIQKTENNNRYQNNLDNLTELKKLTGSKTSPEITQANKLIEEAGQLFKQAAKIRTESDVVQPDAAKLGGYSNAEEKEAEAIAKQENAIAILSKVNPSYQLKTLDNNSKPNEEITKVNSEINKTTQSQIEAYTSLSQANQNEFKLQSEKLTQNPELKKTTNKEAQNLKTEADNINKEALLLFVNSSSSKNPADKASALLKVNQKEIEALKKLNQASELLKGNSLASNNPNTNNNPENKDAGNNQVTNNQTQKENPDNKDAGNNQVTNNQTQKENPDNKDAGNNQVTNNLDVKDTTINKTVLNPILNGTPEKNLVSFNGYTNSEAAEIKNKATSEITEAIIESKLINDRLDSLNANAPKSTINVEQNQQNISSLISESEKLNNDAFAIRKGAATKTGEERDKDIAQARELENAAFNKKVEAANSQEELNSAIYITNKENLEELAKMAEGKNITELADANTTIETANDLYKKAYFLRREGALSESKAAKLGGYNNAEEKEAEAIAKQEALITVYKKYFSNYVPKEPTSLDGTNPETDAKAAEISAGLTNSSQKHVTGLETLALANEKEYNSRLAALPAKLNTKQNTQKATAEKSYQTSQNLLAQAKQESDLNKKKSILIEANKNGQAAIDVLNQLNNGVIQPKDNNANALANAANKNNENTNPKNGNNLSNRNSNPNNEGGGNNLAVKNNNTAKNNSNLVKLNVEGIEVKNTNAYSDAKPIPIDEKMKDGLVFKVQLGAFKAPIPNNQFKGLDPVIGQTTPNGFIRYMAGNFEKINSANAVKNDLKNLGYSDAFVVAYYNGKRITLAEATELAKSQGQTVDVVSNTSAGITQNANIPKSITSNSSPITNNIGDNKPVVVTNELEKLNGLLYTVQIGVFSNQVTRSQLYNLSPIYTEKLPNGLYRYTAGIYNQTDKLLTDKSKVVSLGISDAFVSSYYNSKRIPFAEGKKLQTENNNLKMETENPIVFSGNQNNISNPPSTQTPSNSPTSGTATTNTNNTAFTNGIVAGPTPTPENGVKTDDVGISYKVQIGAYVNKIPSDVESKFLSIKTWPINNTTINGLYIYTIGNFNALSFAKKLKDEAVSVGITDAFVTVYKDGKKLYGSEAAQYLSN